MLVMLIDINFINILMFFFTGGYKDVCLQKCYPLDYAKKKRKVNLLLANGNQPNKKRTGIKTTKWQLSQSSTS